MSQGRRTIPTRLSGRGQSLPIVDAGGRIRPSPIRFKELRDDEDPTDSTGPQERMDGIFPNGKSVIIWNTDRQTKTGHICCLVANYRQTDRTTHYKGVGCRLCMLVVMVVCGSFPLQQHRDQL